MSLSLWYALFRCQTQLLLLLLVGLVDSCVVERDRMRRLAVYQGGVGYFEMNLPDWKVQR